MTVPPIVVAAAGFTAVFVAWVSYLASIPKEKVARRPVGTLLLHAVGVALAGAALWIGSQSHLSGGVIGLSATAAGLALFFVYLLSQAPLPAGNLTVAVDDQLPAFEAQDARGEKFSSEQLAGKRVLLKFFRGSW